MIKSSTHHFLLSLCIFIVAGCASSKMNVSNVIEASWQNPDHEIKKYEKVMVIFYEQDQDIRVDGENQFSEQLKKYKTTCISSNSLQKDVNELENADNVISLLDQNQVEALVAVEFKEYKKGYRPMKEGYSVAWLAAAVIDDDLRRAVWATSVADRVASDLSSMEVSLWDSQSKIKVWSATTDVQTYGEVKGDAKTFTDIVAKELQKLGYF